LIPDRIPLSIVTGFLGSGKTTLIAALLKQPDMDNVAVIVNEFGAVGVDNAIFAQAINADDVFLLANGCLCCSAGRDLCAIVWALTRRATPPRRIIIETSGLADPAPTLRQMMGDIRLRGALRLDALIATIDGINGARNLADLPVISRQCAVADRRIITKTDLATPAQVAELRQLLVGLNPGASVELVANGAIGASKLFDASLYVARNGAADPDRWLNASAYHLQAPRKATIFSDCAARDPSPLGSWLLEEPRLVSWTKLSQRLSTVIAHRGDRLLRMKGLIYCAEDERPLAVHGVQRVFHTPLRLRRWFRAPKTSLVIIGDVGARPAIESIAEALRDSVVENSSATLNEVA
jgi:G3E family GTPase